MIRSMTGFGDAEREVEDGLLRLEIKSVNHRNFNVSMRTPHGYDRHESTIVGWIKESVQRGSVTFSLSRERSGVTQEAPMRELDVERARAYKSMLERLSAELELSGDISLDLVSRFGDVFRSPDASTDTPEVDIVPLEEVTREALGRLLEMRDREGESLAADMGTRLAEITQALDRVETLAPARLLRERDRLRAAVVELTEGQAVDEDRLAREIAYLAEKWDINEEVVRFRSHVELFHEALRRPHGAPVGKRLGFIVQEMNREANTIGSKANDKDIGQEAVAMKEEIEKLREQLENVE